LRVLVANIPLPSNRFLIDLNRELEKHCELVHSSDTFWNMNDTFDVVHLHFPEYLTYEIERAYEARLTAELIDAVEARLAYWSQRSRIVVTRHNTMPHNAPRDEMWARMYRTVYSYADAVVHLACASVEEFKLRYESLRSCSGRQVHHRVIPIHNYTSLPNRVTREEARDRLAIPRDARVMLIFGAIRNAAESALALDAFNMAKVPKKVLLVSRWRETLSDVSWIRLRYSIRDLKRFYHRLHPRHHFNYGYVEEEDTQLYLNAADILFIPRIDALNSANVSLGFTFGKVVVGPACLNAGELLTNSKNPIFDPNDARSAAHAVEQGLRLAAMSSRGEENRRLALEEWDVGLCAAKYAAVYAELVS
jgi:glycosyltransferase involved in cell wall biosynthesis